ncbi:ribonuclease H2 subunit B [Tanacetum coccineum]
MVMCGALSVKNGFSLPENYDKNEEWNEKNASRDDFLLQNRALFILEDGASVAKIWGVKGCTIIAIIYDLGVTTGETNLLVYEIVVCLGILMSFHVVIPYSVPQYVISGLIKFVSAEVSEGKLCELVAYVTCDVIKSLSWDIQRGSIINRGSNISKGTKCDVRDGNDVKNLVKYAQDNLKNVDIWALTIPHKLERTNGSLYAATQVDPVFILSPLFDEARMKNGYDQAKFRQLYEIIYLHDYPGYHHLAQISEKSMQVVCDCKGLSASIFDMASTAVVEHNRRTHFDPKNLSVFWLKFFYDEDMDGTRSAIFGGFYDLEQDWYKELVKYYDREDN